MYSTYIPVAVLKNDTVKGMCSMEDLGCVCTVRTRDASRKFSREGLKAFSNSQEVK